MHISGTGIASGIFGSSISAECVDHQWPNEHTIIVPKEKHY